MRALHSFQRTFLKKPKPLAIPDRWIFAEHVAAFLNFDWDTSIHVDVGCGNGEWVYQQARLNPAIQYVGIEKTWTRCQQLARYHAQGSANLKFIRADAIPLIHQVFPASSVEQFSFFHPNPWPSLSQANKRYFVSSAFAVFDRSLKAGGQIYLVSNTEDYVAEARDYLATYWGYSIAEHRSLPLGTSPRTAFERKYLGRGETLFELRAVKPLP